MVASPSPVACFFPTLCVLLTQLLFSGQPALCQPYHRHQLERLLLTNTSDPLDEAAPVQLQYSLPVEVNALERQTASIIMLHGLGGPGAERDAWPQRFGRDLPYVKWIFPTAPTRNVTVTGYTQVPAWYNIVTFSDFSYQEDPAGIEESARYVQELIAQEVAAGVASDRVLITGFSQGGALALVMLRGNVKLAGVLAMSTYLPLANTPPLVSEENLDTPVLVLHGAADTVVPTLVAYNSYDLIRRAGGNATYMEYQDLGHAFSEPELQDVLAFWKTTLPPLVQ